MKGQPARLNYFFKKGYLDYWNTFKETFLKEDISDMWGDVTGVWNCIFDDDDTLSVLLGVCSFGFAFGRFIAFFTGMAILYASFSFVHIILLSAMSVIVYTCTLLGLISDVVYCAIKQISSNCANCQSHFSLPVYICPQCGVEHTKLRPSKYGIWKRTCDCGYKLPTTFFNGREKLEAHCPSCGMNIKDGGKHVDLCIPVVGGTSSGKTCFIHQSITAIGQGAAQLGLYYEYSPVGMDDYEDNMNSINHGYLPEKTNDMRLKYYQFYLNSAASKIKTLVSLCDVGGEVYSDSMSLGEQIGYKYANAFLLVIDPLSITKYRDEISKADVDPTAYGYSNDSIDEIISMLISTLENMFCISSKDMLKTDVAVVFSKCDIPGLTDKIGKKAVSEYLKENPLITYYDAQNAVCENFLRDYEEINFLNSLKSKFKTIQFFCSSSLGHNMDGTPFEAHGVEDPILWLIDKASISVDLKEKWGKRI